MKVRKPWDGMAEEAVAVRLEGLAWHYKGEGNSNLVVSLRERKVIARLYKTEEGLSDSKADSDKARREVMFWRKILIPHLGKHLKSPVLGYLSREDARHVDAALRPHRPKHRLNKSIRPGLVTIYPDYTFLSSNTKLVNINSDCGRAANGDAADALDSTFCVEIKPKQGWTHPADRQSKCTFCLNQFLKLETGRVSTLSRYCPLDLFSGHRGRMKRALRHLLHNPQNNLKIFRDGHVVFSDSSNCGYEEVVEGWVGGPDPVERWTELVVTALTSNLHVGVDTGLFTPDSDPSSPAHGDHRSASPSIFSTLSPCDWSSRPLPPDSILNRILRFQKLQDHDFKTVYKHYKRLENDPDEYRYVGRLLEEERVRLGTLDKYLLAATAKDCSVLISFRRLRSHAPVNTDHSFTVVVDDVPYETGVGVLDLDPKPMSCIAKHYSRDLNVHLAYLKYISKNEPLKNITNKISL